nr:hypothetical protein [Tanacetum cinerariifolium]
MLLSGHHEFLLWGTSNRAAKTRYNTVGCVKENMGCAEELRRCLTSRIYTELSMSSTPLMLLMRLYHADEINDEGFKVYFQGRLRSDGNFNAMDYWLSLISKEELHLSKSLASTIRCPILKVLHEMKTYGVCQRTTG